MMNKTRIGDDEALPLGGTIGILGGGQLGRMLALAASPLGFRCHVYSATTGPAFDVCVEGMTAKYEDRAALAEFAKSVDVVTYEFENIPVSTVEFLSQFCPVRPNPRALEVSQDRLVEKQFLQKCGAKVAGFAAIETGAELEEALAEFGGNGVLKTRRFGYDGKGQVMLRAEKPMPAVEAVNELGNVPLILEELIPFSREVSVIAVRGLNGETCSYDVAENVHENHILKTSTLPANLTDETKADARLIAEKILSELEYVGTMGVEFFVVDEGGETRLLVNEIAPRVHNSGHWTMDACSYSQFEQHMRAVAGWPLQPCDRHADVVMTNLLGDDIHKWADYAKERNVHFHDYAKHQVKAGRKMGHINRLSPIG